MLNELNLVIKSILGEEKKVLSKLDYFLHHHSFNKEDCDEVKSAIAEACLNAIEHGNLLSPDLEVNVSIGIHHDTLKVQISDQGLGSKSLDLKKGPSDRGLGIFIISQFMDAYDSYFLEDQTIFCMEKKMRKEQGELTCCQN